MADHLDIARIDARAKVTGAPVYGADRALDNMLHAVFAVSTITKGRLTRLDLARAQAVAGVRLIVTHDNAGSLASPGFLMAGGYGFQSAVPLLSDVIVHRGQAIAMVVAATLDDAMYAASLIDASYDEDSFAPSLRSEGAQIIPQAESTLPQQLFRDTVAGDAVAAFDTAAVKIDASFTSPPQHQNPIELIATVAEWNGNDLIIYEGTQNSASIKFGVARILGIEPERVTVISPQAGGGFGQKNSLQMQSALVALAARQTGTPVKMVVPRSQLFGNASFRPESAHRIRLGADADGKLVAALYDVDAQTSRHDLFPLDYTNAAARLYGIPNFRGHQRLVRTDCQTPGYMRAPFEHLSSFALDTAVDEMAAHLGRDPVEYRMSLDTDMDPVTGLPLSSRFLNECLSRGAEMFGWQGRTPEPGSMRSDDGQLIGMGVGCGCYKAASAAAVAMLRVTIDGRATISVGVHEMGQGIRTALANALGQKLGIDPQRIDAFIGDTRGVPQHTTAGSWGTATAVPAALEAADKLIAELGPDPWTALSRQGLESYEVHIERRAPGQPEQLARALHEGRPAPWGPVYGEFVAYSYVAHFVEVRVEPTTRRIRIPRVVSVVDCGTVVSPRTAESQVRGGVVWGIGATLREASEVDARYGGFLNTDIAEYVLPVNADIGRTEVGFINQPDPLVNTAGIKGLGEVVMTGVAAAIANAVWHATGHRHRDLPIRIEHLL